MVNLKALFHYNRHYYLLVVLPILSNHIGLVLLSHPSSPPYPRTESTLGTRDTLLLTAQLAYNLISISTTGISPFFANYGYNPSTSLKARGMVKIAEQAKVTVEKLKGLHQELTRDIEWMSLRSSLYYNNKKLGGSRLTEGD
jgi:hypothetical protein